jgi:fructosamine-3-kinase
VYDRFDIELKQLQILMAKPGQFYSRENIFWQYDLHQGRALSFESIEFLTHWISNRLFPIGRESEVPRGTSEV